MGFLFRYEPSEFQRVIPAVLIDSRASIPAIANQTGAVIKAYFDVEVTKANNPQGVLFFKIETIKNKNQTADGVLVGYFSLAIKGFGVSATLYQFQLRPAFQQFSTQISAEIAIFIMNNEWKQYYL